jgi:hypothetical protein
MAEAMTVETILEADLQLRGFWTRLRFPLQTANGGWSDIDLLAYHPERRELVIAESKVRGPKKAVYAYTSYSQKKYGDILKFDDNNYFSFLRHIKQICKNGDIFRDFKKMVKTLTIHLVSNYYIAPECMTNARTTILKHVRPNIPKSISVTIKLETTLDVISRIISDENKNPQGRRYGHAALDIARELNRYLHPDVRYAGRTRSSTVPIKKALADTFERAFRVVE